MYFIYRISNPYNDLVYIGSTQCPAERWESHCNHKHDMGKLIKSLGKECFKMEVLYMLEDVDRATAERMEQRVIKSHGDKVINKIKAYDHKGRKRAREKRRLEQLLNAKLYRARQKYFGGSFMIC